MALFGFPDRKKTPEDAPALIALGEACIRQGKFKQAITWFDRALDRDPGSVQAYIGKGLALKNLGRDKEALACYNAAVEIGAGRGDALHARARKQPAPGKPAGAGSGAGAGGYPPAAEPVDLVSADAWYGKAVSYAAGGEFVKAVDCFDKALAISPGNVDAWINRGRALGKLGNHVKALESFDRALALLPDDAGAWYYKGMSLVLLRKIPDAYACFEKVLQLQPGHGKAAEALQDLRMIMGQVKGQKSPDGAEKREQRKKLL
jgi:tetratricopeptide (TPR) repeat protein